MTQTLNDIIEGRETDQEDKELREIKTRFRNTPRFKKWRELYYSKDSATFGDATGSAFIAYNLNKDIKKERDYASNVGYQNKRKCERWAIEYLEGIGFTEEYQLKLLASKAQSTNNAKYMQMLLEIAKIYQPNAVTITNNTQNNTQINISDEKKEDFNSNFKKWLSQRKEDKNE